MEIQTMENNLFQDMPQAPTFPKLPKYFPDLQGENRGRTPHAGWYQNDFLPWIQNQDPNILAGIFLLEMVTIWVSILQQLLIDTHIVPISKLSRIRITP